MARKKKKEAMILGYNEAGMKQAGAMLPYAFLFAIGAAIFILGLPLLLFPIVGIPMVIFGGWLVYFSLKKNKQIQEN